MTDRAPGRAGAEPGPAPEPHFPPKDLPLKEDVGRLGALLGRVLAEQEGEPFFQLVEQVRRAARQLRQGAAPEPHQLRDLLSGLDPATARALVHAFSSYFSLTNLAERVHRIRRRREYLRDQKTPQPGGLADVLGRLRREGLDRDACHRLLGALRVEPVFTAHPTEAVRRTLLVKEQRMARAIVDRFDPERLTPHELKIIDRRLRNEITLAWQTPEHRLVVPTVADEVEHTLFFLSDVIYPVVAPFYEQLLEVLAQTYGEATLPRRVELLRFSTWVGGDMDGNPNVGPATIEATLRRQRELIVKRYLRDVRKLFDHLSQSTLRVDVSQALLNRLELYGRRFEETRRAIPARYDTMPYRRLLWFVADRLEAVLTEGRAAYPGAEEFIGDLETIADSLYDHGGRHGGYDLVRRLLIAASTFGFHLASLDLRQDALVHRAAVADLLGWGGAGEIPREERLRRLERALEGPPALPDRIGPEATLSLDVMRRVARCRARFGAAAIGPFIVSMAQGPDDTLALLVLARLAGLVDPSTGQVPLDVVPLFETVPDLERAGETFEQLLAHPLYRRHVEARGGRHMVMLGYSDSNKDSGLVAARWALYRAQEELVSVARRHRVQLTLFHGRGGTASRGGGKPREGILAAPPGSVAGRHRVTEQGEIINGKYGLRGIAMRTLELMTGALLEKTARESSERPPAESWRRAMDRIGAAGRRAYRRLVYDHPDFYAYFRAATPIDVIERMQIGSRPPSRRAQQGIEDLRAIPWVFAWNQCRCMVPGWFGVGLGIERAAADLGTDLLLDMAEHWAFFDSLLGDVEMVMAKADLAIARTYADLAGDLATTFWPLIAEEFDRTRSWILTLRREQNLLDRDPVLQRAIRLRNPYVDPMSLVQVDLLARWRRAGRPTGPLFEALQTSVQGIARGLQNTG